MTEKYIKKITQYLSPEDWHKKGFSSLPGDRILIFKDCICKKIYLLIRADEVEAANA